MIPFTKPQRDLTTNRAPSGVSLLEVIVSMLIMAIGVILLASLLPISILRTAQASQLTQAVFLRNNAAALLQATPHLLGNTQITTASTNIVSVAVRGTPYTSTSTNSVGGTTYAVVDPLGVMLVPTATPSLQFWPQLPAASLIPRYGGVPAGGFLNLPLATNMGQLPDSWTTIAEGPVTTTGTAPVTPPFSMAAAPAPINASNSYTFSNHLDYPRYRVVFTDLLAKHTAIRPLLQATTPTTLSWWNVDATGASLTYGTTLPFVPARGRIDVLDRRFTWLMTVKKQSLGGIKWVSAVDVVIFFNRSFSINDEVPYALTFIAGGNGLDEAPGVRNVDDDYNGQVDDASELGWNGSDDNRTVLVSWTAGATQAPPLKKGCFLLVPNSLSWYRIMDIEKVSVTSARLLLNQDLIYDSGITPPVNGVITLSAILMKGIIDVYSLGNITGQN